MKKGYQYLIYCITLFSLATLAACGGSGGTSAAYDSVQTASYKVEYIPLTAPAEGKSTLKFRVTNKVTAAAVSGATVSLTPNMNMATGMSHGSPIGGITDNADGTYSCTVYYLMASAMADGTPMGTWDLKFTVNGEDATFNPTVAMNMTNARRALKGLADTIPGSMGGAPSKRTYSLFNDGSAGSSVKFFIAAVDNSAMTMFPPVYTGGTFHDAMSTPWIASPVVVELSSDHTTWITATAGAYNGQWVGTIPSLVAGGTFYVRLTVNGEQKTTDGLAVGATNGYQTFTAPM
ncbi:MAG: hypothetical protein HXX17_16505 [Geobacteraceae bacterium]|nr:hypothetical protein [Geobacteraceae bacterium]